MGRDDERTWTELVESFHASTDDSDRTWPDAENIDSGSTAPGPDGVNSPATTTSPGFSEPAAANDQAATNDQAAASDHASWSARENDAAGGEAAVDPSSPRTPEQSRPNDDEHFVPPTPPPIPRTDMITMLAWFAVFGMPVLFVAAYVFGQSVPGVVSFVTVTAFIGGFALLISRLRGHDPHDPDSGAVV